MSILAIIYWLLAIYVTNGARRLFVGSQVHEYTKFTKNPDVNFTAHALSILKKRNLRVRGGNRTITTQLRLKINPDDEEYGIVYYFSDIFILQDFNYLGCILFGYSQQLNGYTARFMYRSKSDGGWRVAFGAVSSLFNMQILKGDGHYTQESKLIWPIVTHLEWKEDEQLQDSESRKEKDRAKFTIASMQNILRLFMDKDDTYEKKKTVYKVTEVTPMEGEFSDAFNFTRICYPATCWVNHEYSPDRVKGYPNYEEFRRAHVLYHQLKEQNKTYTDYFRSFEQQYQNLANMQIMPNFSDSDLKPIRKHYFEHSILGKTEVEVFTTGKIFAIKDKYDTNQTVQFTIEWQMAKAKIPPQYTDEDKYVYWIDRICPSATDKSMFSSYGALSYFIDSGFLTNKPLEYNYQSVLIEPELKKFSNTSQGYVMEGKYHLITYVLEKIPPLEDYINNFQNSKHAQNELIVVEDVDTDSEVSDQD